MHLIKLIENCSYFIGSVSYSPENSTSPNEKAYQSFNLVEDSLKLELILVKIIIDYRSTRKRIDFPEHMEISFEEHGETIVIFN